MTNLILLCKKKLESKFLYIDRSSYNINNLKVTLKLNKIFKKFININNTFFNFNFLVKYN